MMSFDTNILSKSIVILSFTSILKRERDKFRKHIYVKHILFLFFDKALIELNPVHTSENKHAENSHVLLIRILEKEESSKLQNYDVLSCLDVVELQIYNPIIKCSHSDN